MKSFIFDNYSVYTCTFVNYYTIYEYMHFYIIEGNSFMQLVYFYSWNVHIYEIN